MNECMNIITTLRDAYKNIFPKLTEFNNDNTPDYYDVITSLVDYCESCNEIISKLKQENVQISRDIENLQCDIFSIINKEKRE